MNDHPPSRVLLVDDELDFLDSLSQRLRLRGFEVLTASSGQQALDLLGTAAVDVVVLDVRMPGMDGIETLRLIKEQQPLTEVIMLTGHADLPSSLEGMRFGFFDYLTKPVHLTELIDKIRDAHRRRRGEAVQGGETFGAKLEEHMMVADRLASLGELAASIAHEINNPLAVISESSGWLRSRTSRPDTSHGDLRSAVALSLDKIDAAVDRAARISRNFLRFARGPGAQVSEVDLADLAAEIVELTSRTAASSGIELRVSTDRQRDTSITTDPYQLRQVLLNLVTNAIQAVDQGGTVEIVVGSRGEEATVSVVDNGPGIPEALLERIFEPFFTTKGEGHGTGLGLAVSRGIVEKLGGRIEVDSRPGVGCTFTVVLPGRHA